MERFGQGFIGDQQVSFIIAGRNDLGAIGSGGVYGICVDRSRNIYVSDPKKHIILKITDRGETMLWAGKAGLASNNGGNTVTASNARFNHPAGLACDNSGNVYIADAGNHQIRKIDPDGNVSLLAGAATPTSGYVDGVNLSARFFSPHDVDVDSSGKVYVADMRNHTIRVIAGGMTDTLAGNGTPGFVAGNGNDARFRLPMSVAANSAGRVYVADTGNYLLKRINNNGFVSIISGSGEGAIVGEGADSRYHMLKFVKVDMSDRLYAIDFDADGYSRLLRIDDNGTSAVVVAFTGLSGFFANGVAVDRADNLYVTESNFTEIVLAIEAGSEEQLPEGFGEGSLSYHGVPGTTANVVVNGVTFVVGNVAGSFVWDIGGSGEHTFTTIGESISRTAGNVAFDITWDGML